MSINFDYYRLNHRLKQADASCFLWKTNVWQKESREKKLNTFSCLTFFSFQSCNAYTAPFFKSTNTAQMLNQTGIKLYVWCWCVKYHIFAQWTTETVYDLHLFWVELCDRQTSKCFCFIASQPPHAVFANKKPAHLMPVCHDDAQ